MATHEGVNYANRNSDEPKEKVGKGELNGRMRMLYDEIDVSALTIAASDLIKIGGKLPAGARVMEAMVFLPNQTATGIVDLGWEANGVDAVDLDGFISGVDGGGQIAYGKMSNDIAAVGFMKKFTVETQVQLDVTEVFGTEAGTIQVCLWYVVD